MAKINVLPKNVAELIAAGEVVERPASVIKELVENSIDAGATAITVEIQHGGVTYMRVTDNGCGIAREDVKTAFLRHATSKIKTDSDLNKIGTLGFRGEALAAVCSVARVELLTCTEDGETGTKYAIYGGEEQEIGDTGAPKGTTIIIRDLFYNTPARMKFLKTDATESNAVGQIMDRVALSHPEIAFRLIRDGKNVLTTSGDGRLSSAIYSVLGRDYHSGLIPVENTQDGVSVSGFVCAPVHCRPNRNGQFFFLNGRLVKSGTACAALEQAYKNSAMVGKFPYCVLNITVPLGTVDVNVHPAKTEVRFADEKRVFSCIYYAVKTALSVGDTRPEMKLKSAEKPRFEHMSVEQFRQTVLPTPKKEIEKSEYEIPKTPAVGMLSDVQKPLFTRDDFEKTESFIQKKPSIDIYAEDTSEQPQKEAVPPAVSKNTENTSESEEAVEIRFVGEAFKTYIVVEKDNELYLVDKHAAHERILFEKLKSEETPQKQLLLSAIPVTLQKNEYNAITENPQLLEKIGFEVEDFGNGSVLVSAVPSVLADADIKSAVAEIAESIIKTGKAQLERIDDIYHIVACRSAIKAGNLSNERELTQLAARVLSSKDIMYCPHGRPVAMRLTRREIEKQFGRIQ